MWLVQWKTWIIFEGPRNLFQRSKKTQHTPFWLCSQQLEWKRSVQLHNWLRCYSRALPFCTRLIHQPNNILSNFYVSQTTSQPTLWLKQSFPLQLLATQPKCVSVFLDLWKNYQACEPLFGYSLNSPHHPYFVLFFSPVAHSNALTFKDLMCVWQDPVHGILFVVFLVPEHVFPNLILCFLLGTLFISIWAFPKLSTPSFPFFYWTSKKTKSWTLSYNTHLFFQLFW